MYFSLTLVRAGDAVQRPRCHGHHLLPLQGGHPARPPHVVVGPVAQAVVVALAPGEHGPGAGQGHGELRAALDLDGA